MSWFQVSAVGLEKYLALSREKKRQVISNLGSFVQKKTFPWEDSLGMKRLFQNKDQSD